LFAAGDAPVVASAPSPLSLAEVVTSAEELFPLVNAARADVDAAEGEQLAAAGAFDPVFRTRAWGVPVGGYPQARVDSVVELPTTLWGASFFGGYRFGSGKIQPYYGERETWSAGELRAGAVVPVLRNGPIDRRRATLARAQLGRALAGLSLEQQQLEISRLAAFRYWDWVAAGMRREVARALLAIAVDRDRQLEGRARLGDVAVFDRQDNERALVQREAFLVSSQRGVEQSAFELSLYLRADDGDPAMPDEARLPRTLPEPLATPPPADVDEALARRPDVQRLLNQRQQAEIELRLARNQLLPALDLGLAVTGGLGVPTRPETQPLGEPAVELNAVFELPVLFRTPRGRIEAASAALTKLDAQLRLARDRVEVELRDARSALDAAHQRVDWARKEVAVALALETGERTRFNLGDSTLLFVNLREQTTAEARLREIDALLDYHKAVAALAVAAGLRPR
jgi:outer membrane protein TolC